MPKNKNLVVLIREDPTKSHRAVEAIRIAIGLSTGSNPIQIILTGKARLLVTEDALELPDGEILEKYLPVIQNLQTPVFVEDESIGQYSFDQDIPIQSISQSKMGNLLGTADRVLVF